MKLSRSSCHFWSNFSLLWFYSLIVTSFWNWMTGEHVNKTSHCQEKSSKNVLQICVNCFERFYCSISLWEGIIFLFHRHLCKGTYIVIQLQLQNCLINFFFLKSFSKFVLNLLLDAYSMNSLWYNSCLHTVITFNHNNNCGKDFISHETP